MNADLLNVATTIPLTADRFEVTVLKIDGATPGALRVTATAPSFKGRPLSAFRQTPSNNG
jgi:hypothetical protein